MERSEDADGDVRANVPEIRAFSDAEGEHWGEPLAVDTVHDLQQHPFRSAAEEGVDDE